MHDRIIHIFPGTHCSRQHHHSLYELHIEGRSVFLTQEAAALLVSYLKVIKAYFFSFKRSRSLTLQLYGEIAHKLEEKTAPVVQQDISQLIEWFGCAADWDIRYRQSSIL